MWKISEWDFNNWMMFVIVSTAVMAAWQEATDVIITTQAMSCGYEQQYVGGKLLWVKKGD